MMVQLLQYYYTYINVTTFRAGFWDVYNDIISYQFWLVCRISSAHETLFIWFLTDFNFDIISSSYNHFQFDLIKHTKDTVLQMT